MTPQTRKPLESIIADLERWLLKHPSVYISGIKSRVESLLKEKENHSNGEITPCERVSYEKCLDRLDEEIKRLKGQVSHDAWGPKWTPEQSIYMKELKAKKKEILGKLGLPI